VRVDRLDKWLRGTITVLIVGVYVGKVFYDLNGNYSFLTEFDYYFTTISTTSLALFLRWLYSDTGLEVELNKNDKIRAKETLKAELIQEVNDLDLVDVLELAIIAKNKVNKLKEYKIICDTRVNFFREKAWWKFGRKRLLAKWRDKRKEIGTEEFSIDAIKLKYYEYNSDEMLSSFYKENKQQKRYRKTKADKVVNSTKANLLSFIGIAVLKGADWIRKDFSESDLIILGGQLIIFFLNIYSGYNLGKSFVKEDYSQNLTDDYIFLKSIIKNNK